MSALPTAALVSVLGALAMACAVHGLRPRRRSLAQVRAILYPVDNAHGTASRQRLAPLDSWVEQRLGDGLQLIDLDAATVASRVLVGMCIGAFSVVLSVGALSTAHLLPMSPLWFLLALGVGAAAGWIMWSDVQTRIERRRRDFRRTTNDFIQLVAVGLTTDQSVDEAIQFALGVGDSDMFSLLRTELSTAPVRGVPIWEALDQLGRRCTQRELSELGASIERQGTQGVSITDTVNTLATSMRERALDDLEREADTANANLSGPTVCFVVTTIVFLAFPLARRIGEAFSG